MSKPDETSAPAASTQPTVSREWPPGPTVFITAVLFAFGLALVFQASRWARTPAYGNLLNILLAPTWGYVYLAVAALMVLAMVFWTYGQLSVAAHTAAFALLLVWEAAFFIRYRTDSATTVANVLSWLAYLYILLLSAKLSKRHSQ
jgi:hypothetical protein